MSYLGVVDIREILYTQGSSIGFKYLIHVPFYGRMNGITQGASKYSRVRFRNEPDSSQDTPSSSLPQESISNFPKKRPLPESSKGEDSIYQTTSKKPCKMIVPKSSTLNRNIVAVSSSSNHSFRKNSVQNGTTSVFVNAATNKPDYSSKFQALHLYTTPQDSFKPTLNLKNDRTGSYRSAPSYQCPTAMDTTKKDQSSNNHHVQSLRSPVAANNQKGFHFNSKSHLMEIDPPTIQIIPLFKEASPLPSSRSGNFHDPPINATSSSIKAEITSNVISGRNTYLSSHITFPEGVIRPSSSSLNLDTHNNTWGLPTIVQEIYHKRGISKYHDWQLECLRETGVLEGNNLVYTLPTSGGKTFVSEILLLRTALKKKRLSIFVVPFVSIVQEKVKSLKEFGNKLGFQVDGFYHNSGSLPIPLGSNQICVCTLEKANVVINALTEEGRIGEIGCVVLDELHMLGDEQRGYLLEVIITKLKYFGNNRIQMVGMSATLPNLDQLTRWMNAVCYSCNYRPVQLIEHVVIGDNLYKIEPSSSFPISPSSEAKNGKTVLVRILDTSALSSNSHSMLIELRMLMNSGQSHIMKRREELYTSHIPKIFLLIQEISPFQSALVFCSSKAMTLEVAILIASLFKDNPPQFQNASTPIESSLNKQETNNSNNFFFASSSPLPASMDPKTLFATQMTQLKDKRNNLIKRFRAMQTNAGSIQAWEKCLLYGVAFHNASQTAKEKELIEYAFRERIINVICCTSTLAAGVNLPARRVFFVEPKMGTKDLTPQEYKQMAGRAGRAGIDTIGESFLFSSLPYKPSHVKVKSKTAPNFGNSPSPFVSSSPLELPNYDLIKLISSPLMNVSSSLGNKQNSTKFTLFQKIIFKRLEHSGKLSKSNNSTPSSSRNNSQSLQYGLPFDYAAGLGKTNSQNSACSSQQSSLTNSNRDTSQDNSSMNSVYLIQTIATDDTSNGKSTRKSQYLPIPLPPGDRHESIFGHQDRPFNVEELLNSDLVPNGLGFDRLVLEAIGARTCVTFIECLEFINSSLYASSLLSSTSQNIQPSGSNPPDSLEQKVENILSFLHKMQLVELISKEDAFRRQVQERASESSRKGFHTTVGLERDFASLESARFLALTDFGAATYRSSFSMEEALFMRFELERAQKNLVISTDLHLCCLVCPVANLPHPLNAGVWLELCKSLSENESAVASLMGSSSSLLEDISEQGFKNYSNHKDWIPTQRFFCGLLLLDIINEEPLNRIAVKYSVPIGDVESLMTTASVFANQAVGFCARMKWWALETLLRKYVTRIQFGAKEDVLHLTEIRGIKASRARTLFNNGYHTPRSIAMAEENHLSKLLGRNGKEAPKLAKMIILSAKAYCDKTAVDLRKDAKGEIEREKKQKEKAKQMIVASQRRSQENDSVNLPPSSNEDLISKQVGSINEVVAVNNYPWLNFDPDGEDYMTDEDTDWP